MMAEACGISARASFASGGARHPAPQVKQFPASRSEVRGEAAATWGALCRSSAHANRAFVREKSQIKSIANRTSPDSRRRGEPAP